jgi:hypothetical protein
MDCEDLQTITSQQYDNNDNINNDNDDSFNNDNDDIFNNDNDDSFNNDNDDNINNDNYDNDDNDDNQEDNQPENRVIQKSQKSQTSSQVWDHFKKASDFKKSKKAICKYCGLSYVCSGGSTSNLMKHLKKQHPIRVGISKQSTTIDEMFGPSKVDILFFIDFISYFS